MHRKLAAILVLNEQIAVVIQAKDADKLRLCTDNTVVDFNLLICVQPNFVIFLNKEFLDCFEKLIIFSIFNLTKKFVKLDNNKPKAQSRVKVPKNRN